MQKQAVNHANIFLSPHSCGFRKGFSSKYASSSKQEKGMKEENIDNNAGSY